MLPSDSVEQKHANDLTSAALTYEVCSYQFGGAFETFLMPSCIINLADCYCSVLEQKVVTSVPQKDGE